MSLYLTEHFSVCSLLLSSLCLFVPFSLPIKISWHSLVVSFPSFVQSFILWSSSTSLLPFIYLIPLLSSSILFYPTLSLSLSPTHTHILIHVHTHPHSLSPFLITGFRVFVVPEAATVLFLNGASPDDFSKAGCAFAFQQFVIKYVTMLYGVVLSNVISRTGQNASVQYSPQQSTLLYGIVYFSVL